MRVFIAVPLPSRTRKELAKIQKDFRIFPAKWVEEENLHITLVFIGDVRTSHSVREPSFLAGSEMGEISEILKTLKHKPISLKTDGLTLLPSEKKAHILAVKLAGETEKLIVLTEEIKKGLRERKILRQAQDKPFRPHVTLARFKKLRSSEKKELREKIRFYDLPEMEFKAKQIELTESKLTPVGPVYEALETTHLR